MQSLSQLQEGGQSNGRLSPPSDWPVSSNTQCLLRKVPIYWDKQETIIIDYFNDGGSHRKLVVGYLSLVPRLSLLDSTSLSARHCLLSLPRAQCTHHLGGAGAAGSAHLCHCPTWRPACGHLPLFRNKAAPDGNCQESGQQDIDKGTDKVAIICNIKPVHACSHILYSFTDTSDWTDHAAF